MAVGQDDLDPGPRRQRQAIAGQSRRVLPRRFGLPVLDANQRGCAFDHAEKPLGVFVGEQGRTGGDAQRRQRRP